MDMWPKAAENTSQSENKIKIVYQLLLLKKKYIFDDIKKAEGVKLQRSLL